MDLLTITSRPEIEKERFSLLVHGFRPFFLLASGYGSVFLSAWLVFFFDAAPSPASFRPVIWHGHEMVFGFAVAAVCGFLLTASSTWSNALPVTGRRLGVVVWAWVAGRAAMWLSALLPVFAVALIDLALMPVLAAALWPVLTAQGSRKNLVFLIVLAIFFTANLMVHLESLFGIGGLAEAGLQLGVYLLAALIIVVIGRIAPTFITVERLAVEGPKAPLTRPVIEWLAIGSVALLIAANLVDRGASWVGLLALAAAAIQIVRIFTWRAGSLLLKPHLAALHLGYGWIIAGLVLTGIAYLDGPVPEVSAIHAITVGGIGTMILAVMSIVSLLHTGRPAQIRPVVVFSYLLITAAAFVRAAAPILFFESYKEALIISGALWTAAFGIFLSVYWPILTRPRPDGIPG
ncbi:MAG: NnrS family protein [Nitrospinota bacterium]|nr:NnrS family protein [Nitrospinota bacterium]